MKNIYYKKEFNMRDFRKILSLILAIAMMLSTGISIMANEPGEEKEYKVNFVLSPDIDPKESDIYPTTEYFDTESGKLADRELKNGDALKERSIIKFDSNNDYSYYLDGKEINGYFNMPKKDVTIFVTTSVYGRDYIFADEIDKKPDKWVTVTLTPGEGKFKKYLRVEKNINM